MLDLTSIPFVNALILYCEPKALIEVHHVPDVLCVVSIQHAPHFVVGLGRMFQYRDACKISGVSHFRTMKLTVHVKRRFQRLDLLPREPSDCGTN